MIKNTIIMTDSCAMKDLISIPISNQYPNKIVSGDFCTKSRNYTKLSIHNFSEIDDKSRICGFKIQIRI